MITAKHLALTFILTLCPIFCSIARAQMPALDVAIDSNEVRFAAAAQEMRVEVYAPSGEMIFDSGAVTDQAIEWKMQDAEGKRVPDGIYLVTIQLKTAAGQVRKRIEQVVVGGEQQRRSAVQQSPNAVQSTVVTSGATSAGRLAKFASSSSITNSVITENNGLIGFGINAAPSQLHVRSATSAPALLSVNASGDGVLGQTASTSGAGVHGVSTAQKGAGGFGEATNGTASTGVFGKSTKGYGVAGLSTSGNGVQASSNSGKGVSGISNTNAGVYGFSSSGTGVYGESSNGHGVHGVGGGDNTGVFGGSIKGDGG